MPWLGLAGPAGRPGTSAPAGGQRLSCGYARVPDACERVKSRTGRDADAGLLPPQPDVPHLDPANRPNFILRWEKGQSREPPSGAYTPPALRSQPHHPLLRLGPGIRLPRPGEGFYWIRE